MVYEVYYKKVKIQIIHEHSPNQEIFAKLEH